MNKEQILKLIEEVLIKYTAILTGEQSKEAEDKIKQMIDEMIKGA